MKIDAFGDRQGQKYWLMKTEPETFSIDDLKTQKTSFWDGVRNYQARNHMRDGMKKGDLVLFYHSSTEHTGIYGIAEVVGESSPDPSQFDSKSLYFDPKATKEKPRWFGVTLTFKEKFKKPLLLRDLREIKELRGMLLLQKGSRLSVQPVKKEEFSTIMKLKSQVK